MSMENKKYRIKLNKAIDKTNTFDYNINYDD